MAESCTEDATDKVAKVSIPTVMTVRKNRNMNCPRLFRELYPDDEEYSFSRIALDMKYRISIIWAAAKSPVWRMKSPYAPAASPAAEKSIARHICQGSTQGDIMVRIVRGKAILYGMSAGTKYSTASIMKIMAADSVILVLWVVVMFPIAGRFVRFRCTYRCQSMSSSTGQWSEP